VSGAAGSLLPLSWFFTGYPIEYGFFNTHVALPIVLSAVIVYLAGDKSPVMMLAVQCLAATLLLAVWSPLVLLPAALGFVIVVRSGRAMLANRGWSRWIIVGAGFQLLAYGFGVVLPNLLRNSGFLSAQGGAIGFGRWLLVALGITVVVLAAVAFRSLRNRIFLGVVALVVASWLGLGALLFISRDEPTAWTYYPLKFSWLSAVVMIVIAAGLAAAVTFKRSIVRAGALTVVAAGTAGFLVWLALSLPGYQWQNPVDRILRGEVLGDGDVVAEQIFTYSDSEQAHFFWHSGDPWEGTINFWVMQLWSDSMTENLDLKYAAYGLYDPSSIDDLCRIIGLMGGDVIVHTNDATLEAATSVACADDVANAVFLVK
jgi:hypothetical protein